MTLDGLSAAERRRLAKLVANPLTWAETMLINPEPDPLTGEEGQLFRANYVERKILPCKGTHQHVVVRVHRRAGKTISLSVLALHEVLTGEHRRVLVVGPMQSHIDEIFRNIRAFLGVNPVFAAEVTQDVANPQKLVFSNGSQILGKTTGSSSKGAGKGIRGQGADLVIVDEAAFLNEEDFLALGAIFRGDLARNRTGRPPKVFVASTPIQGRGRYYEYCKNKAMGWHEIHVPITENPDATPEYIQACRAASTEYEWLTEWMAEFPDIGEGVFRPSYVERAQREYSYTPNPGPLLPGRVRVLGVDWDKVQAGPNLVCLELQPDRQKVRLIHREEIPQTEFTLTRAVDRILELDGLLDLDWIYVDRGYGEQQVESLKLAGKRLRAQGVVQRVPLEEKVVPVSFSETVKIQDPVTGQPDKKPIKPFMIFNLVKLFEDDRFEFSLEDATFKKQLLDYRILSKTGRQVRFSSDNEHIIDACALAYHGIFLQVQNPFGFRKPETIYRLPIPEYVPRPVLEARRRSGVRVPQIVVDERPERSFAGLRRSSFGRSGVERRGF